MVEKSTYVEEKELQDLYEKSKWLIDSARSCIGQAVNWVTVYTNFYMAYRDRENKIVQLQIGQSDCRQSPRHTPRIFLLKELEIPLFSGLSGSFLV